MNKDRDLELTTRAGEVDDIAAQEAIEDERAKQQHAHHGGTLEVSFLLSRRAYCDHRLIWPTAIHQPCLHCQLLLRAPMLLGSGSSRLSIGTYQWRSSVYRVWQYLGGFWHHACCRLAG